MSASTTSLQTSGSTQSLIQPPQPISLRGKDAKFIETLVHEVRSAIIAFSRHFLLRPDDTFTNLILFLKVNCIRSPLTHPNLFIQTP
jgi:hypothetical protein